MKNGRQFILLHCNFGMSRVLFVGTPLIMKISTDNIGIVFFEAINAAALRLAMPWNPVFPPGWGASATCRSVRRHAIRRDVCSRKCAGLKPQAVLKGKRSMTRMRIFAFAAAIAATIASMPVARAGEIEHAQATIGAIERDRAAVDHQAGYFYEEMNRADATLRWHAWMERMRGEQMNRSGCMQPPSENVWAYCTGLYNDMQAHARWREYLIAVVEDARARHMAAVQQLAEIQRAGQWWHTRLAMLTSGNVGLAWGRASGNPIETGSIDTARWGQPAR